METETPKKLLIFVGPSGVGKSTLIDMLIEEFPSRFQLAVGHTTRPPRLNEVPGVDYIFLTRDQFIANRDNGEYFEYVENYGNFYGVSETTLDSINDQGRCPILILTPPGIEFFLRQEKYKIQICGILPGEGNSLTEDIETLRERLKARGDPEDVIQKRLAAASSEIDYLLYSHNLSCLVRNKTLADAYKNLVDFLQPHTNS